MVMNKRLGKEAEINQHKFISIFFFKGQSICLMRINLVQVTKDLKITQEHPYRRIWVNAY